MDRRRPSPADWPELRGNPTISTRKSVAIIDFHIGLGSYGFGEPICGRHPDEAGQARA